MKIFPLSEGSFTIDNSKLFVPFDEETDKLHERKRGSLLVEVQPFLVETGKDLILLDTGLGFEKDGKLQLLENIMNAGFQPGDVTKVLLSHLHKDHAGGIGKEREGLGSRLSIPSARYFLQQDEFNFAFEKGFPSYITEELLSLQNNSQVELLAGNGLIDDYIRYEVTGAHSPFHQVFWINEKDETLFFGADDAPQLHQMKHRFAAKYDFDGKKAMELRQEWWQLGNKENWNFLFYHDIKTPVYKGHQ
jgi:glyoxylase-like metal-dependent hydrolase (beta-lactamase superfamily II)